MEKSSSPSINCSIAASLSNCRPFACSKACLILCRVSSPFGATGRDPRVPQNRTCIAPPKNSLHLESVKSLLIPIHRRGSRRDVFQSRPHGWKHLKHLIESADLKYFLDPGLQTGNNHFAVLLSASLSRSHEHSQTGAANIDQSATIQQELFLFSRAAVQVRRQRAFEGFRRRMVDPSLDLEQDYIGND